MFIEVIFEMTAREFLRKSDTSFIYFSVLRLYEVEVNMQIKSMEQATFNLLRIQGITDEENEARRI